MPDLTTVSGLVDSSFLDFFRRLGDFVLVAMSSPSKRVIASAQKTVDATGVPKSTKAAEARDVLSRLSDTSAGATGARSFGY
jgi:hypothetical protein